MKCNLDKGVIIPVGLTEELTNKIKDLGFTISDSTIIIAMAISNNEDNFVTLLESIKRKISNENNFFRRFNLSLPGLVRVAKTILYSQLNYLGCILPIPDNNVMR